MDIKTRYTVELTAREGAAERVADTIKRMSTDENLSRNAKLRTGNVKMEKWWSVVAGLLLVIVFILYSFYLTIPAVILLGVLIAFLIYVGISLKLQQRAKDNAEHEISPRRSADAFINKSLGLTVTGRDATVYMDNSDIGTFGIQLLGKIAVCEGADTSAMFVTTSAKVTDVEEKGENYSLIPLEITVSLGKDVEMLLKYNAPFAIASTGDCVIADTCPVIGEIEKSEIKSKR